MTDKRTIRGLLHRVTHRIPGVPAHTDQLAGHRFPAHPAPGHGHSHRHNQRRHHSPGRPPRFLPNWQRRIAAIFNRQL